MTELKTLKDLVVNTGNNFGEDNINVIFEDELKAEAVKWIKHFGAEMIYKDFMDFFNLTSEDLA